MNISRFRSKISIDIVGEATTELASNSMKPGNYGDLLSCVITERAIRDAPAQLELVAHFSESPSLVCSSLSLLLLFLATGWRRISVCDMPR